MEEQTVGNRKETTLGPFRSIAFTLLVLALPVALIATNVRFAASEPRVYDYSVREYDAAAASHIPESELIRANRELVDYFAAEDPGPLHVSVTNTNGQEESLFNARETAHLADVHDLFQAVFTIHVVAIALALGAAMVLLATAPVRALAQGLLYGSLYAAALVAGTGALAAVGFDDAWRQLHFFAFTNDLWELDPATDHLIQMFPRDFWFDVTMLLGAFTLLQALLVGVLSGAYLYFTRHQVEEARLPRRPPVQRPLEPRPRIPPPRPRHITH